MSHGSSGPSGLPFQEGVGRSRASFGYVSPWLISVQFTDEVVNVVDKYGGANLPADSADNAGYGRGLVWLVWGAWAAKRVAKLDKVLRLFPLFSISMLTPVFHWSRRSI